MDTPLDPFDASQEGFPPMPIDPALNRSPLQHPYCFWFLQRSSQAKHSDNYAQSIKYVATVYSIESFWACYSHMKPASELPLNTELHFFKRGIKPLWEDPSNRHGGKLTLAMRKMFSGRFWEELLLAIIGEQFDVGDEICGAVISVRHGGDLLSVWHRSAHDISVRERIRETLRRVLHLTEDVVLDYKAHDDAAALRRPPERPPRSLPTPLPAPSGASDDAVPALAPQRGGGGRGQWRTAQHPLPPPPSGS